MYALIVKMRRRFHEVIYGRAYITTYKMFNMNYLFDFSHFVKIKIKNKTNIEFKFWSSLMKKSSNRCFVDDLADILAQKCIQIFLQQIASLLHLTDLTITLKLEKRHLKFLGQETILLNLLTR